MAIGDPLQWVIIGVIVIAIFLWGPQKIPEIARGIGKAKREFDLASKEVGDLTTSMTKPITSPGSTAAAAAATMFTGSTAAGSTVAAPAAAPAAAPTAPAPEKSGDQILIETARSLGIVTEGKTRDQISQEIVQKANPK